MSNHAPQPDAIRNTIRGIVARSDRDAEFRQHLLADPLHQLLAAGVPADAANAILAYESSTAGDEVEGYLRCVDTTCIISICPGTCITWYPDATHVEY
jgi:hypothetical protein